MTGSGAAAWERISSRKNGAVLRLRRLGADPAFRREQGETVLDGEKLLREALASGCRVTELLAGEKRLPESTPPGARLFCAPEELVSYASPVKNSPGPVFSVSLPSIPELRARAARSCSRTSRTPATSAPSYARPTPWA